MKKVLLVAAFCAVAVLVFATAVYGVEPAKATPASTAPDAGVRPESKAVVTAPPPRPAVRSIPRKVGDILYVLKVKPGAPEPGDMVEFLLDVVQMAPVPHPVYGDRIPMSGMKLTVKVAHEKAPDAPVRYQVQPFGDVGTYGFHYTPDNIGTYLIAFSVLAEGRDQSDVKFSIPVGIWPLPADADRGDVIDEGKGLKGEKRGMGMTLPVGPVAPEGSVSQSSSQDAVAAIMSKLGRLWMFIGKSISGERKLDLNGVAREVEFVPTLTAKLKPLGPDQSPSKQEYEGLLDSLASASKEISAAAKASDAAKVEKLYNAATYNSCTRCHLKYRFRTTDDLSKYPAAGQGK